jgi:uncharacterized membrane protein YcaP (DUF421 family)
MSLEDLLCELHLAGYTSPTEIDYAILESNGKLAFFPIYAEKPLTKGDFSAGKPLPEQSLAHPLIIDGKIMKYAMKNAQKSEEWLFSKLKKSNIKEIGEVFLMTVDDTDKTEIITKKECKP